MISKLLSLYLPFQDSEMGDCKMGDSYSGNDDGSDDNQRDCGDMRDPSVSRRYFSIIKIFFILKFKFIWLSNQLINLF